MKTLGKVLGRQPLILAIVPLFVVFSVIQPNMATAANMLNIGIQSSVLVIAATGMTFVILTAGIDLSVGAMLFLGAAVMTTGLVNSPPAVSYLLVVLLFALVGAFNGVVIAKVGIPAFIVTLATLQIFRGAGGHITKQRSILIAPTLRWAGTGDLLGVPVPIVIALLVMLAGHLVLMRTVFGRYVQAVGSSDSAAQNAGLPRTAILVGVYALAGLLAGVAAIVQIGRLGATEPSVGIGFELTVITAVVLGGTSLFGGTGTIIGSALGAVTLGLLENGLVLTGASPYSFDVVRGIVLLAALLLSSEQPQRVFARFRTHPPQAPEVPASPHISKVALPHP